VCFAGRCENRKGKRQEGQIKKVADGAAQLKLQFRSDSVTNSGSDRVLDLKCRAIELNVSHDISNIVKI
jgi:hypothetical protein